MNELSHGPGKGDKDRSPGWRNHYDEIDWKKETSTGFRKFSTGQRKVYKRDHESTNVPNS